MRFVELCIATGGIFANRKHFCEKLYACEGDVSFGLDWVGNWGRLGGERGAERFSFGQIEVELGEEESLKGGMRTTRDHNSASALVEDSNTD